MKRPKEDPTDKAARLRERRMSELDLQRASEGNAAALTSDLRSVYGFGTPTGMSFTPMRAAATPSIFNNRGNNK